MKTAPRKKNQPATGLAGRSAWVAMVDGTLITEPAPGHGTAMRAEIPFRQRGAA
jgi:signal transduction histidine kinase